MLKQAAIKASKAMWLDEHLPYELMMMRHSLTRMQQPGIFPIDWNAFHSSFSVAAANLAAFLTNTEKKSNSFQASEFVSGFRARKKDLAKIFQKLEPQIFHLGKTRTTRVGKFDLEDAKVVAAWIEENMADFVSRLPMGSEWNETRSLPPTAPEIGTMKMGQAIQTACTADPMIITASNAIVPEANRSANFEYKVID